MELTDLKKTWDKLSTNRELNEEQLKAMLGKHTKTLIERVERNIRIGFIVLFALFVIIAFDEFLISPLIMDNENLMAPNWLLFLDIFSNILIFTTFIYFAVKYYLVKQSCNVTCELKETLRKIIDTLNIYQRLFYLALIFLTITMALGFITGLYQESAAELERYGIPFSEIQFDKLLFEILIVLVFLIVVVGGIFIFFRWGFRRLYGNYILKLKQTLKELNEIDN